MAGSAVTITVAQFAQQLKQKYPQYASAADDKLVAAFVSKNPQYKANYQDTELVSVSFEPAATAAPAQKPGVTNSIPVQSPTVGASMNKANQPTVIRPTSPPIQNPSPRPPTQQASTAVMDPPKATVVRPAALTSSSPSGTNAQATSVPSPSSPGTPYLGNTVFVKTQTAPAPLMVGKYEIVDELGRGGMGLVYKAYDPGIGRTVALKVMSEQLARDTDFRERFLREARGAGILQHPNIVTVHELGEWQGAPFIAMEFLEGRSLEDILKDKKASPLEKRLDIVAQACRGLDYAHARGIVHRDIKPANVMVTKDGVAKIVDFGIARLADQKMTNTGHVLGTVSYMSPEQLQGRKLDGRSDIFAVGVMLFEALTSVLPFAAEDTGSAITSTLYRQPPKLSSFLANYPNELDEIISKCLAKDPAERFQTAGELADRLSKVQQELQRSQAAPTVIRSTPLPAEAAGFPPPVLPQQALPKKRGNTVIAIAIASLVLVSAVGLRMLYTRSHSSAVTDVTELRKRAESGDADAQYQLAHAYNNGVGIEKDYSQAVAWYRKAAEQGNPRSQNALGFSYLTGRGVNHDDAEATRWFTKAAEQGNRAAQCNLGGQYEFGRGISQDITEAVRWYRKSAEQGYPEGQFSLGNLYEQGKGVPQDSAEAARWYRKAADQGLATAQHNLASMYKEGLGVGEDYSEAVRWYRKAADQGFADSQINLGSLYQTGRGVAQDYGEAVRWYRKAAEQGNAIGQFNLGVMYSNGTGVDEDYAEAASWFRKAAEQGYAVAQFNMGKLYEDGLGVAQDYGEAARWYRKAADQGNANAQINLKSLQKVAMNGGVEPHKETAGATATTLR